VPTGGVDAKSRFILDGWERPAHSPLLSPVLMAGIFLYIKRLSMESQIVESLTKLHNKVDRLEAKLEQLITLIAEGYDDELDEDIVSDLDGLYAGKARDGFKEL
jgi:hypothetical protein